MVGRTFTRSTLSIFRHAKRIQESVLAMAEQRLLIWMAERTPAWIMPKRDRHIAGVTKALYRRVPAFQRAHRALIYWLMETRVIGFAVNPKLLKAAQGIADGHRRRQVPDPALREKLTPDYTMGCKRVLISNNFYPALAKDHVELVSDAVAEVRANSVVSADGTEREVDAIIYGTGFHVTDSFDKLHLVGPKGRKLSAMATLAQRGLTPEETPEAYQAALPEALESAKRKLKAEHNEVQDLGGLYVLGTERHESRRIDNQLRGRSGRQGDPGESRFYLSLEDDLMKRFASDRVTGLMERLGLDDDVAIESRLVSKTIESAQSRVEADIQPNNRASLALAKKCGFVKEGFSRRFAKIRGRWQDHERWAITAEDWKTINLNSPR